MGQYPEYKSKLNYVWQNLNLTLSAFAKKLKIDTGFTYEIGEYVSSEGGIILHRWLSTATSPTPSAGPVENYLVLDTADLSTGAQWASSNVNIPNVESLWDGSLNTVNLIAAGAGGGITAGTAAVLCNSSTSNGKTDWYLPSIEELKYIYLNKWYIIQGIAAAGGTQITNTEYFSSSELTVNTMYTFGFVTNAVSANNKTNTGYVRAIRKFSIQ